METEKTPEQLYKIIEDNNIGAFYGNCDGEPTVVFHGWSELYRLYGILNEFEDLKDRPYLSNGETYQGKYIQAKEALEKDPDNMNWSLKREKESAFSWFMFQQHLATREEEVNISDYGVEEVFSDEYDRCIDCGDIIRTSPCSYSWTPPLFIECEGYSCDNCAEKHTDYILEEFKNVQKSIPDSFSTEKLGLVKINEDSYQNGMHYGMDDSPEPIIKKLNAENIDVWFKVFPSQFNVDFDVYVLEADGDRAKEILAGVNTYQGYSTAGNLEKALKSIPHTTSSEGVVYNKIDVSTGCVETRVVSREEFIKGIKD